MGQAPSATPSAGLRPALHVRGALAGVVALGALVAMHGTASLPLDGHEALVVETAQEMRDRGEWVVPYYNHEPRLSKPPLSYWLTRLAYELTPTPSPASTPGRIAPWHGRLPSVLSGIVLLVVVFAMTRTLFDEQSAVVASLFLLSSVAFFGGTHDARSDLLYTLLCATGVAGFVRARDAGLTTGGGAVGVYAMWASFGFATLAKGPHVPLIFLVAIVAFCLLRAPHRLAALRGLRPFSGVLLGALLSAPWWVLLRQRVGHAALRDSQLSGALLTVDWRRVLDPYYFHSGFLFALPWVVLLPVLVPLLRRRDRCGDSALLLVLLYVSAVVLLSAGPQKRLIYMLPASVPLLILLGAGAVEYVRTASYRARVRAGGRLVPAYALLLASAAAWFGLAAGASASARVACVAAVGFGLWLAAWGARRRGAAVDVADLARLGLLAALVFVTAGASPAAFERSRYEKVRLAEIALDTAGGGTPVAAVALSPSPYVYYTGRRIDELDGVGELSDWLERSADGRAVVLIATGLLGDLPSSIGSEALASFSDPDPDDATTLLRVWRRATATESLSEPPR